MKINIDTDNKTVTVLDSNNLALLVKYLKKILDKDYNEYTYVPEMTYTYTTYTTWASPIVVTPYVPATWPTLYNTSGTYNIEIQEGTVTVS